MSGLPDNDSAVSPDDLAASYLAGAMTNDERAEFESRLEQDAELCSVMASYDSVCDALIDQISAVEPDDTSLQSLLTRIDDEEAEVAEPLPVIHRGGAGDWQETGVPGMTMRILNKDRRKKRMTALLRMEAGASYPAHAHTQDEECFMLEGDLIFDDCVLHAGDYLRMAAGTAHGIARTRTGCVCLITTELPDSLVA